MMSERPFHNFRMKRKSDSGYTSECPTGHLANKNSFIIIQKKRLIGKFSLGDIMENLFHNLI